MHTAYTADILPGVGLTCVKAEKFKTGCLTVNLVCGLDRDTAAEVALFPRVLRRGSAEHPGMDRIAAALDDLYGARVEPIVRKKGELHCAGFYADFPDDRFIRGGGKTLEETVSLLGGLLLSPDTRDGILRADFTEGEKINLIDDIRASVNDKRGYSIDRLLEEMCAGEPYGVGNLGAERQASEITPESLTARYREIVAGSRIEAFYCGAAEPERVISALSSALSGLPERKDPITPKTGVVLYPAAGEPRRFTEALDVTQGKLAIGFRLGKAMENPDYPAMILFNAIYGGSVTSKLFLNVRERLSLCYYAGSMLDKQKGVMIVSSGVDFEKFDAALDEILAQLENVRRGEISDREFTSAKNYVMTSIKSAMDRPGGLEELYFDAAVAAVPYDPDELCDKIGGVTLDRVIETASEIKTDSVYYLTGKGQGGGVEPDDGG